MLACDIHPVNNLRVLRCLQDALQVRPEQKDACYRPWVAEGLAGAERLLERHGNGPWCFGEQPMLADCCLMPQVANAVRMRCDTEGHARTMQVYRHAIAHPAFQAAQPQKQPDYINP